MDDEVKNYAIQYVSEYLGMNLTTDMYDEVSIQEVIDKKLAVVDLTASIMCMENRMPMYVFGLNEENSIVKAMTGEFSGTKVTVS